jgi:hypothetical protein
MGPGVTPAAAFAQESPAAWRQTRFALAVKALALGCGAGLWGVGVSHWAGEAIDNRHRAEALEIPFLYKTQDEVFAWEAQLSNRANRHRNNGLILLR